MAAKRTTRKKQDKNAAKPERGTATVASPLISGGQTIRTEEIVTEILRRIADGESLRGICGDKHLPTREAVREWLRDDKELAVRYARARHEQADHFAEEIQAIADEEPRQVIDAEGTARVDPAWVAHQRNRVDARKWLAAKMHPEHWADKSGPDVSVSVSTQVTVLSEDRRKELIERRRAAIVTESV